MMAIGLEKAGQLKTSTVSIRFGRRVDGGSESK